MTNGGAGAIINTDNTENTLNTDGAQMFVRLKGKKNIYEEIVEEYSRYISAGVLAEGEKLPSCRALAAELGINPNTVERAYAELERQGYVRTIPKKGAFVAVAGDAEIAIREEAERQLTAWKGAGLGRYELEALIDKIYGKSEEDDDDRT